THADRDAMIGQGADLPDCFENRVLREGICFYKALTAPRQFLWLSWPGGEDLPPSAALLPVLELLQVPAVTPEPAELGATPAAALDLLGSLWQSGQEAQRAAVQGALEQSGAAAQGLRALHRAAGAGYADAAVEDTAALERLLGPKLRVSPTKFERYTDCPFGYFLQYVLGARPRVKAELAPNISGTLTHWVLEQALARHGEGFTALSAAGIEALVDELIREYAAENLPGEGVRMDYLLGRIARNLVGLLQFMQQDFRQSGFHPVAFELRIGEDGVPPVELPDGNGHTVRVVGTIDRVDAMPLDGKTWLRVVDYKTGSKSFDLREVWCGKDCQMLIYLFTLVRNGGARFPNPAAAGVEYLLADPAPKTETRPEGDGEVPRDYPMEGLLTDEESVWQAMDTRSTGRFVPLTFQNGKLHHTSRTRLADAAKMDRIRDHLDGLLLQMARRLYGGDIAAAPLCDKQDTPCRYCDFRSVCGHRDGENERRDKPETDPFA
ncbi:MAG: PD-(D/E)XK nuclease family protein, partial [Gemmiger sp.]